MVPVNINFKELIRFDGDLLASSKTMPAIIKSALKESLVSLRNQARNQIPISSGKLRRSFGYSIKTRGQLVRGTIGFMTGKRVSASTAIAANVLQAGGARPRKGAYLWIPVGGNRAADGSALTSPRELINFGGYAVIRGNSGVAFLPGPERVPAFVLKTFVKLSRPPIPIEADVQRAAPEIEADIENKLAGVIELGKYIKESP